MGRVSFVPDEFALVGSESARKNLRFRENSNISLSSLSDQVDSLKRSALDQGMCDSLSKDLSLARLEWARKPREV